MQQREIRVSVPIMLGCRDLRRRAKQICQCGSDTDRAKTDTPAHTLQSPVRKTQNDCEQFRRIRVGFGPKLEHASSQVHFTFSTLVSHANKQVIGRIDVLRASEPNELYHKLNYGPRSGTRDTRANSMRCVLTQTPRRHCSRRRKPFFYGGRNTRMARHSWVKTDLHMLCMEKYAAGVPWAASALGVQVLKCQLQKPEQ